MEPDAGAITLSRPKQGRAAYQTYQSVFEYGERLLVRVVAKSADGLITVQTKGQVFSANDPGNTKTGNNFIARVAATEPDLVIERLPESQAQAFRVEQAVAPKVSYLPALMESMEKFLAQVRSLSPQDTGAGRMIGDLKSLLQNMLDPTKITPGGLSSLFSLLGAKRQTGLSALFQGFGAVPMQAQVEALLKLPAAAWREALDAGWTRSTVESLLKGLSSTQKSVEILRAANIVLFDKKGFFYVEWPPYHPESGPLRILIRRDGEKPAEAHKKRKGDLSVQMDLTMTSLGEVRVRMNYGKTMDVTIQSGNENRKFLEGYRTELTKGLGVLKKPVQLRFTTLSQDTEEIGDLAALLGKAKGGDGRLHLKV
jgi:hypothetical protein